MHRFRPLLLALAVGGAACADSTAPSDPAASVASVRIDALPGEVELGDTLALGARVADAGGTTVAGVAPRFSSATPATLALTASGGLVAVGAGRGVVYAEVSRGSLAVVRDSVVLQVVRTARTLAVALPHDSTLWGDTLTAVALAHDRRGASLDVSVRWRSGDTLVARVDSLTGLVRIVGDGEAEIVASSGALTARDTVRAWLPRLETGSVRLAQLGLGWNFGCGLDAEGRAYCWGMSNDGQLGRGVYRTGTQVHPFAPVTTSSRYESLSVDRRGACGVTRQGALECWGLPMYGGAYPSDWTVASVPQVVTLPSTMQRVAYASVGMRRSICAVDIAGAHACFGDNLTRQLGPGGDFVLMPTPIQGAPDSLASLTTGEMHGCGVATGGALHCWGQPSSWGSSGSGAVAPTLVAAPPTVRQVVALFQSTCALDAQGRPWCGGAVESRLAPLALVPGAPALARIAAGPTTACGLATGGGAWCWDVQAPLLGNGIYLFPAMRPTPLSRRHAFVDVAVGLQAACGLTADGEVRCREVRHTYQ